MKDEQIQEYKKIYLEVKTPEDLTHQSWKDLSLRLPEQERYTRPVWRYSAAFAAILLVLLVGIVATSQAAKAGNVLFPVKQFSQAITGSINKSMQNKIFKASITPAVAPTPTSVQKAKDLIHMVTPSISPSISRYPNKGKNIHDSKGQDENKRNPEEKSVKGKNTVRQNNEKTTNENKNHEVNNGSNNSQQTTNKNANSSQSQQNDL